MMGEKNAAKTHWKKAAKMVSALLGRGFNSSKCKTMAKMTVARVKLLRNKREVTIRQMRRDIAMLLDAKQDSTARIRVEHVIREQNIMAANELIELFCELVVSRLSIISKQRDCPPDLKEGISSLIFAAPRCSEIPELVSIQQVFQKKYGKDFVSAATDLRPNAGVNRLLIEKLSVKTPSGEMKLKVLKDIAKEYQVQWDTTESEAELLKPPEERIEGPNGFVSATSLPVKPTQNHSLEPNNTAKSGGPNDVVNVQELVSAVGIAAEKALAAVEAAASLAHGGGSTQRHALNKNLNGDTYVDSNSVSRNSEGEYSTRRQSNGQRMKKANNNSIDDTSQSVYDNGRTSRRQSYNSQGAHSNNIRFDESDCDEEIEMEKPAKTFRGTREFNRRHSSNAPTDRSGVRYDEYDDDEDDDDGSDDNDENGWGHSRGGNNNGPPGRPAPNVPVQRTHPKLPDYDTLAARFEALKNQKAR